MKFVTKGLIASFILVGGIALAGQATDPDAKARQDLMDANGAAMKVLGGMASGDVAFDATAAAAAVKALVDDAANIPVAFKNQGAADPKSSAKPEIWANWDAFLKDAAALGTAASAMDATSLDGIKAGLGAVGGACKTCHTDYKAAT
jgi:cytochrome c556